MFLEFGDDPLQRRNWDVGDSTEEKERQTQIWSQDLLSFRSLNQESADTLQTARTSSLVDGRLAHIVLSDDKETALTHTHSMTEHKE